MKEKNSLEIPDEIRIVIEEIVNAFNEKRLVSIMTNNPTLTFNKDKNAMPHKKIVFEILNPGQK